MKIANFIASRGLGGAEKCLVDLSAAFSKEHSVTVIAFESSEWLSWLKNDLNAITIPFHSRYNPLLYWRLYRIMSNQSFDVVCTLGAKASFIIYYLSKFVTLCQVAVKSNPRKGKIFEKINRVISVSRKVSESIEKHTRVIFNGIKPTKVEKKSGKSIPFRILSVGRLDKIKGFDLLIREVSKLSFDFHLKIAGDGQEFNALQQLIRELNLQDSITLLRFREDIPKLMAESDLVVLSSHSEGFSLVILESLFYSNLLISTHVGGADETLGENFLYNHVELANKIEEIYTNYNKFCSEFQRIKKEKAGQFLLANIADEYIDFFKESCRCI